MASDRSGDQRADGGDTSGDVAERLAKFRDEIDRLDEQIVRLLNDRAACALQVGSLKNQADLETYQPKREVAVLQHVRDTNRGPLADNAITRLFERIIDENRQLERQAEEKSNSPE